MLMAFGYKLDETGSGFGYRIFIRIEVRPVMFFLLPKPKESPECAKR
jgi:hypothetical protein